MFVILKIPEKTGPAGNSVL